MIKFDMASIFVVKNRTEWSRPPISPTVTVHRCKSPLTFPSAAQRQYRHLAADLSRFPRRAPLKKTSNEDRKKPPSNGLRMRSRSSSASQPRKNPPGNNASRKRSPLNGNQKRRNDSLLQRRCPPRSKPRNRPARTRTMAIPHRTETARLKKFFVRHFFDLFIKNRKKEKKFRSKL